MASLAGVLSVERQTGAYGGGVVNVEVFIDIVGLGLFSFHLWHLVNKLFHCQCAAKKKIEAVLMLSCETLL